MDKKDDDNFVVRIRRGKVTYVDKQILRWRKARKKAQPKVDPKTLYNAPESPISDDSDTVNTPVRKGMFE